MNLNVLGEFVGDACLDPREEPLLPLRIDEYVEAYAPPSTQGGTDTVLGAANPGPDNLAPELRVVDQCERVEALTRSRANNRLGVADAPLAKDQMGGTLGASKAQGNNGRVYSLIVADGR